MCLEIESFQGLALSLDCDIRLGGRPDIVALTYNLYCALGIIGFLDKKFTPKNQLHNSILACLYELSQVVAETVTYSQAIVHYNNTYVVVEKEMGHKGGQR